MRNALLTQDTRVVQFPNSDFNLFSVTITVQSLQRCESIRTHDEHCLNWIVNTKMVLINPVMIIVYESKTLRL